MSKPRTERRWYSVDRRNRRGTLAHVTSVRWIIDAYRAQKNRCQTRAIAVRCELSVRREIAVTPAC